MAVRKQETETFLVYDERSETLPVQTADLSAVLTAQAGITILPTLPQEFIKAEKNLETLGFFTPSSNWTKDAKKKIISFTKTEGNKRVKVSAIILPSAEYGLPDTSDLDKYRAFQKILSEELIRNGKVPKHITFTSTELIEAMGERKQSDRGGKLYQEVRDWLMRMKLTGIQSEGAVWLAGKKAWVTDTVSVFDRVIAYGQELEDGTIADCHHVWLSDWQLENINEFWLLSIDYDLYKQLRKPIAKSLLPLLQIGFYASGGTYTKRYDELCQFLGITTHKKYSYIKQQLEPSFKELRGKGFLAKWDYDENELYKTYNITWQAGDRFYEAQELLREREKRLIMPAKSMPKRITKPKQKPYLSAVPAQAGKAQQPEAKSAALPEPEVLFEPTQEPEIEPETFLVYDGRSETTPEPLTKEQADLVNKLVGLNVSRVVALDLVRYFDNEFIKKWTEAIHYTDANDKAAYLVKAIREDWLLPEKWLTSKEQEKKKAEMEKFKQLEEERQREKERKRKEEAEKLNKIYNSLSPDRKEEVDFEAEKRLSFIAREWINEGRVDSPIVQAERKSKREEVLKEWLKEGKIESEGEQI
jgi:hypothetical protein